MASGSVTVHALSAGYLTLPEAFFVTPLEDQSARNTVPSLSFLIQHTSQSTNITTQIIFDLGIRRRIEDYAAPIYRHSKTREPLSGEPDTVSSLAKGGLTPADIDFIIFSHLHWDHIGTPSDYPESTYVIGPGAMSLINGEKSSGIGSHSHFEIGLLPPERTVELPHVGSVPRDYNDLESNSCQRASLLSKPWISKGLFEAAMDVFGDGSLYIVSAPGHLDGHINLLCRLDSGKYVYLAGDACHDRRLLTGEKDIATWTDPAYPGEICCIHADKEAAKRTLDTIRATMSNPTELGEVEVVFSHDAMWEKKAKEQGWFFPGSV
ncbi:Metallo-beta-lactamase superfamily [Aspergillus sclerotialis]|uniref:Metallo-beta-lactamase superfamily n=1 Tax=Aspergillus sclerotialis TaxID=2070753 RepID=A0A3A3A7G8_9EURO|nr:Metallo-beta-lactamase superfamily [Aspergillus sclerotialis]